MNEKATLPTASRPIKIFKSGHIVPVARLEGFRALKSSKLEGFRALNTSKLEAFRALKAYGQIGGFKGPITL